MKFKDITEVGFYRVKDDTREIIIFEVLKNTDEDWLKDDPTATLLVDTWLYDYTDSDDRKLYNTNGAMERLDGFEESELDLIKLEKEYVVNDLTMVEKKLTYQEQVESLQSKLDKILKLCKKEETTYISISDGMRTYSQPSESSKFAKKVARIIEK